MHIIHTQLRRAITPATQYAISRPGSTIPSITPLSLPVSEPPDNPPLSETTKQVSFSNISPEPPPAAVS